MGHMSAELKPVVNRILSAVERLPEAEDLEFAVDIAEDARMPMEKGDVTELAGNLLDNARKWAKSQVRISFAKGWLIVEDDGPGVADEELETISQRGRRLDESKQGWGLGLSIVEDIADIYGLKIVFGRSDLGGLKVAIGA